MSDLMNHIREKALALGVPLSAHLDLTWRCNEHCRHCYLTRPAADELTTAEVCRTLDQLASAGSLFLCLSGGEIFLRPDLLEIVRHARSLMFNVVLKTNATLLKESDAEALARLFVARVDVSIYSDRPEAHDAITGLPGSFERSLESVRTLVRHGVKAQLMHVVTRGNENSHSRVQDLAETLGVGCKVDPVVTPGMHGNPAPSALRIGIDALRTVYRDPRVVKDVERFCAAPPPPAAETLNDRTCDAGRTFCYISPSGNVTPCVQFPLVCGNVRRESFAEIWKKSSELARVRDVRTLHLSTCRECASVTVCSRCPGLAYVAGDLLGPSPLDCEKTFARTGVPTPLYPDPRLPSWPVA